MLLNLALAKRFVLFKKIIKSWPMTEETNSPQLTSGIGQCDRQPAPKKVASTNRPELGRVDLETPNTVIHSEEQYRL